MGNDEKCSGPCDRREPSGASLCDVCKRNDEERMIDIAKAMVFRQKPRMVEIGVLVVGEAAVALEADVDVDLDKILIDAFGKKRGA